MWLKKLALNMKGFPRSSPYVEKLWFSVPDVQIFNSLNIELLLVQVAKGPHLQFCKHRNITVHFVVSCTNNGSILCTHVFALNKI